MTDPAAKAGLDSKKTRSVDYIGRNIHDYDYDFAPFLMLPSANSLKNILIYNGPPECNMSSERRLRYVLRKDFDEQVSRIISRLDNLDNEIRTLKDQLAKKADWA